MTPDSCYTSGLGEYNADYGGSEASQAADGAAVKEAPADNRGRPEKQMSAACCRPAAGGGAACGAGRGTAADELR